MIFNYLKPSKLKKRERKEKIMGGGTLHFTAYDRNWKGCIRMKFGITLRGLH
jgi:hypothetical protein